MVILLYRGIYPGFCPKICPRISLRIPLEINLRILHVISSLFPPGTSPKINLRISLDSYSGILVESFAENPCRGISKYFSTNFSRGPNTGLPLETSQWTTEDNFQWFFQQFLQGFAKNFFPGFHQGISGRLSQRFSDDFCRICFSSISLGISSLQRFSQGLF